MTIYHSWYDNNAFLESLSWDYYAPMKTNNKAALVTGANRGLGLQTARELGKLALFFWEYVTCPKARRPLKNSRGFPMIALRVDISILAKNCRGN
jgi:hypothetical protein